MEEKKRVEMDENVNKEYLNSKGTRQQHMSLSTCLFLFVEFHSDRAGLGLANRKLR